MYEVVQYRRRVSRFSVPCAIAVLFGLATLPVASGAHAATLCVDQSGGGGCFTKISDAVSAAQPGDTIHVYAGAYPEDVVVGKAISLIGAGSTRTIINAAGRGNGIYVDGLDNSGLRSVVVSGFEVKNANFEGILVVNAGDVTIRDNVLTGNDKALKLSSAGPPSCPGIPGFETGEAFDCGEALHLMGVDHSVVERNTVYGNAGGILISDDTAATFQNLISSNVVRNNPLDCGITVASHSPASSGATESFGVYQNTIASNESDENGLQDSGGAGVGLFAGGPGNKVYANVVIGNRLIGNGLPGVAMHNHAAPPAPAPAFNLNDNVIVGNYIARNHADTQDAATNGPTGINVYGAGAISGTVIAQNIIRDEAIDVATRTPGDVLVHLNALEGAHAAGVSNAGRGSVNATENWWGCSDGPGHSGCSSVEGSGVSASPWLTQPDTAMGGSDR